MPATNASAAVRLRAAADRLVARVGHWTPQRWADGGRADRVYALVQELADLGATAEGRPARPVPRLDHDLALVDQVRVMVADLDGTATADAGVAAIEAALRDLSAR